MRKTNLQALAVLLGLAVAFLLTYFVLAPRIGPHQEPLVAPQFKR